MAPRKPRKTKTAANYKSETASSVDSQNHCPLFDLPPELRNMIYTYASTPGPWSLFDRTLASENLGSTYYKIYTHPPSNFIRSMLLRTCRRINSEAASIFAAEFHELTLVVDLSKERQHLDRYMTPRLDENQMSRLKRIIVINDVRPPRTGWYCYVEQITPSGTPYWARDIPQGLTEDELVKRYREFQQNLAPVHAFGRPMTLKMGQYYAIMRFGGREFWRLRRGPGVAVEKRSKRGKAKR